MVLQTLLSVAAVGIFPVLLQNLHSDSFICEKGLGDQGTNLRKQKKGLIKYRERKEIKKKSTLGNFLLLPFLSASCFCTDTERERESAASFHDNKTFVFGVIRKFTKCLCRFG